MCPCAVPFGDHEGPGSCKVRAYSRSMTVRGWLQPATGILSAVALAVWVGQSVVAYGVRPAQDRVDTIQFAYFLNDRLKPIDDCTFSIVADGHAPTRVAVDGERLRFGNANGQRRLEFRCSGYPPDDSASAELFPATSTVVFTAYTRPHRLDKELKRDESKWPDERSEVLGSFHDAREFLRKRWLDIPRSAREKAGGAFAWRASSDGSETVTTTFRYADQPKPTTLPVGLAGSWNVVRRVSFRSGDALPAAADTWVGRTARFAGRTAEFGLQQCPKADYVQMVVDPERFFPLVFGFSVRTLDLPKKVSLIGLSCADSAWSGLSGFVVRDKDHVFGFLGGVFFEMARAD